MKTLWILQKNIHEKDFNVIKQCLNEIKQPFKSINVIPFSTKLDINLSYDGPVICYGSTTLIKLANKDWTWYDENTFKPSVWGNKLGEMYINHDARIMKLNEVLDNWKYHRVFIRPNSDLKLFSGDIFMNGDFCDWYTRVKSLIDDGTYVNLKLDTEVSVAEYKRIIREWRFFIVDKKIVTCSQYKENGKLKKDYYSDSGAFKLAKSITENDWQLAPGYVVDIGLIESGKYKVIEFNNFNSSGFYYCDIKKILLTASQFKEKSFKK